MKFNFKSVKENLNKHLQDGSEKDKVFNNVRNKIPMDRKVFNAISEGRIAPTTTQLVYILRELNLVPSDVLKGQEANIHKYEGKPLRKEVFANKVKEISDMFIAYKSYKTYNQMSKIIGMTHSNLNNYISGIALPTPINLLRLCYFFNVTPEYFSGDFNTDGDGKILKDELKRIIVRSNAVKTTNENTVGQYISRIINSGQKVNGNILINNENIDEPKQIRKDRVSNYKNSGNKKDVFNLNDRFKIIDLINTTSLANSSSTKEDNRESITISDNDVQNKETNTGESLDDTIDKHIELLQKEIEPSLRDLVENYINILTDNYKEKVESLKKKNKELEKELETKNVTIARLENKLDKKSNNFQKVKNFIDSALSGS